MTALQIEPALTVDVLREQHAVAAAVMDHDHTGLPQDPLTSALADLDPQPGDPELTTHWLGRSGGEPVAALSITWPQQDNLETASIDLSVHPAHRRLGHGQLLLEHALSVLKEAGRTRAFFEVCSPWDGGEGLGEPLLRRVGARPVLAEARRLLDLTALTAAAEPGPAPEGYRVEQWIDRAPDELIDGLAYLSGRMTLDAPMGEMDYAPEVWDAARYRKREESSLARDRLRVCTVAVHEATGAVAGTTDYGINREQPQIAYQWDTIVDPDHRGHGLGLLVKAHNLQLLQATLPVCRWVNTWNALSNTYMVAVNDALGFVPVERWTEWQLDL